MDLLLNAKGVNNPIEVVLIEAGGSPITFAVPWPTTALRRQEVWRRNYLAHHDPAGADVSADAVRAHGSALVKSLQDWLAQPAWRPIDQQRQINGETDVLRLSFGGESDQLQSLPWESISAKRRIWRTEQPQALQHRKDRPAHQPRVLVWVGNASGLDLAEELKNLKRLQRGRQIHLKILEGDQASLEQIAQTLAEGKPWDGLIFLGHSDSNPVVGGQIHLADGSWVNAQQLEGTLHKAAERGLHLVMLNSCSGLDLARSIVSFGVPWAVCFREPIPCKAASEAFSYLIAELKKNKDLIEAAATVRERLRAGGAAGSGLLLTVVASPSAKAYSLPLSKRRLFQLRVRATSSKQLLAAAAAVALGGVFDVVPNNPMSHYGLDRRLYIQRHWRQTTNKPGPNGPAIPVLVIDQNTAQRVGAEPLPNRVSRQALARLLARTSPRAVPKVALDVVLDETAPHSEELAKVISNQGRSMVFAGYFGDTVEAPGAGAISEPQQHLKIVGLKWFNLSTGMVAGKQNPQPAPLLLVEPITSANFAAQLSRYPARGIPTDAVIDWSLNWGSLIQRIEVEQLPSLTTPILLIGTDGNTNADHKDLFTTPGALRPELSSLWKGSRSKMPGVMVQAALAQSINLKHWLIPFSSALATILTASLGIALSALIASRPRRILLCGAISAAAIPFVLHLAISTLWLIPLLLPLCTLLVISGIRED